MAWILLANSINVQYSEVQCAGAGSRDLPRLGWFLFILSFYNFLFFIYVHYFACMYVCVSDGPEVRDSGELRCRWWTQVSVLKTTLPSSSCFLFFFFPGFDFWSPGCPGTWSVYQASQTQRSTCLCPPSVRCAPAAPPGWLFLKCTQKSLNSKML